MEWAERGGGLEGDDPMQRCGEMFQSQLIDGIDELMN